tara:strand:+ start:11336 stop:11470 length:135 start_codon:yes stop_codon:yes gene_type:complete
VFSFKIGLVVGGFKVQRKRALGKWCAGALSFCCSGVHQVVILWF